MSGAEEQRFADSHPLRLFPTFVWRVELADNVRARVNASVLKAVEELRTLVPKGMTMVQFALRWILMHEAVTCAIPGAKRPSQVEENVRAADLLPLSPKVMRAVSQIFSSKIKPLVHNYW